MIAKKKYPSIISLKKWNLDCKKWNDIVYNGNIFFSNLIPNSICLYRNLKAYKNKSVRNDIRYTYKNKSVRNHIRYT